jgi:sugar lactone lactonase YvrE
MAPLLLLLILAQAPTITTYVGPNLPSSGSQAITQTIGVPEAVTPDGTGGFYLTSSQNQVYRVSSDGILTVIAGTGAPGVTNDGVAAAEARLNYVHGIAADSIGNVVFADTNNGKVRKITLAGALTTVAGTGGWGSGGDGGPALSARLAGPRGLALDATGNLYIADTGNNEIRMVTPDGIMTTVAGNGTQGFSGDGGPAISAQLNYPVAVAVDGSGNLFVADRQNNRIRMVNSNGVISTVTGSAPGFSGDGGPAVSALISDPRGVGVDVAGNVFIADSGNNRIRMVNAAGIITTVAGSTPGFSGDGGLATSAQLALPVDVAVDGAGNIFIADRGNYRIRRINPSGVITSVAGKTDDGGSASSSQLNYPNVVAADGAGNVFIADTDSQRVRKVATSEVITTVAGNGTVGFSGDGGPAPFAQLNYPAGIAVDRNGNVFIADTRNNRIREVVPGGIIATIAGNGKPGFAGDGGSASDAQLNAPSAVAVDQTGNVFISDTSNQRVRKIDFSGVITTVAGTGDRGFGGDGGPATSAQLTNPAGIAIDGAGNIFIADAGNNRIRVVASGGGINTFAGDGMYGFGGDGGPAVAAHLAYPNGVALDGAGNLLIADTDNQRIRAVTADGLIRTVAGNGTYGFSGDGGASTTAELASPLSVATDAMNSLVVADTFSSRIRHVVSSVTPFAIGDRAGIAFATDGRSTSIRTGYGIVQADPTSTAASGLAIYSYRSGTSLVSETSISTTSPLRSGRIYAEVNGPLDTGIAIANPNNQNATIQFFFTDLSGNDAGAGSTTVGAGQQIARFLGTDPFKTFAGSLFQGTFTFTSDVPVAVVAIRGLLNERQEFLMSTLPVVDITVPPASGPVVIPHFSSGGGWSTEILLVNPTDGSISGNAEFRDEAGATANVIPYAIAPRSSQKIPSTGARPTTMNGSVRVIPSMGAAPSALVVFSYRPGAITISEAGVSLASSTAFRMYAESSGNVGQSGSIQSGMAVTNIARTPASITLELTNLDGSTTGLPAPVTESLPPNGHLSRFLAQIFPALPQPFKGMLRISTPSEGIAVVGLRSRYNERGDFLITTTPPAIENASPNSTQLILPHLPDGGGYSTEFILLSGSAGQTSSGSLLLFLRSGQPFAVPLR